GDHAGVNLRNEVKTVLDDLGFEYEDVGADGSCSVDYPDYAFKPAERLANGEFDRGIFICGTGVGISISANKVKGTVCTVEYDGFRARARRQNNNDKGFAQGERGIGDWNGSDILRSCMTKESGRGRHETRRCTIPN